MTSTKEPVDVAKQKARKKLKMKKLIALATIMVMVSPVWADWDPGDGHKMHFPQLPDPFGWDVAFLSPAGVGNGSLADDWQCSQTGPVDDIHFWISLQQSSPGTPPPALAPFRVSIRADVPAGSIPGVDYSTPGIVLWTKNVDPTDASSYKIRSYGSGTQGWYDPWTGYTNYPDHEDFFQINLTNLSTAANPAFQQNQGTIYWLEIEMIFPTADGHEIGWKTADLNSYPAPSTGQHFMDDAVYSPGTNPNSIWQDLYYPNSTPPKSLDLAFVITPEPGTMVMLVIGGIGVLARRKRRRG